MLCNLMSYRELTHSHAVWRSRSASIWLYFAKYFSHNLQETASWRQGYPHLDNGLTDLDVDTWEYIQALHSWALDLDHTSLLVGYMALNVGVEPDSKLSPITITYLSIFITISGIPNHDVLMLDEGIEHSLQPRACLEGVSWLGEKSDGGLVPM